MEDMKSTPCYGTFSNTKYECQFCPIARLCFQFAPKRKELELEMLAADVARQAAEETKKYQQVKIFEGGYPLANLEAEVNAFLKETRAKVIRTSYTPMWDYFQGQALQVCNQWMALTIVYEVEETDEKASI